MTPYSKVQQRQQGYIMVWLLFYFALLSLMALWFMDTSIMEILISSNHRHDVQAFAMADGGVLMGAEKIHSILVRDYSQTQEIPRQIMLDQQEWRFHQAGSELTFYLGNPQLISETEGACSYQFISQGDDDPARKTLQVNVRVTYKDYYLLEYAEDGTAILVFDHRDYLYPVQIIALKLK